MERLTRRKEDGSVYCRIEKGKSFVGRLAAIEDILGDDYDLGRLRCAVESLAEAEARADEAETALTAAVRDMETMALTIRQRRDHDTDCCPFCHYNGSEEDYCPGWEGEECFQWRGK